MDSEKQANTTRRTAAEAGWHVSRYNLQAPVPGKNVLAIANLFKGTCAEYSPIELYLMSVLDEIDEHHPIIDRLAKRGVIVNTRPCNHWVSTNNWNKGWHRLNQMRTVS